MTRRAGGWLALAMAWLALGGRPALAQDVKVGKINMDKVYQGYTLYLNLSNEYRQLAQSLTQQLEERHRLYPLLIDDEWNQLVELKRKGEAASPADKAKLAQLERLSNDRDKEMADLQAVPDDKLTAANRQRRKDLTDIQTKAQEHLAAMKQKYDQMLQDKDKELSGQLEKNINSALELVAKDKGLSVVLRGDAILWGGVDVTEELLAKLNAAAPKPPAGGTH